MKKLSVALFTLALMFASQVHAFGFGDLPGLGSGAKVDTDGLNASSKRLVVKLSIANNLVGTALEQMLGAVVSEEAAQKHKAALDDANKIQDDGERNKKITDLNNNASNELAAIDFQAKMNKTKANYAVTFAFLKFGAAILLDAAAAKDGQELAKSVSASGPAAAMNLVSVVKTTMFVANTLPGQISNLTELSKKLKDYADTNKIPLPSTDEIAKEAASVSLG